MREFYFKDKNKNFTYCGIIPYNDVNCAPFDYYRYNYTEHLYWTLKHEYSIGLFKHDIRQIAQKQVDEYFERQLSSTSPKNEIHKLLTDDTLSKKEQNELLKGVTLKAADFLWLNKEAQELGYMLDIYHEEKYPVKFSEKKRPVMYCKKEDGFMDFWGSTDMTEGEMNALLEQRKVVQARIYHKGEHWHCFYFTFKGLAGEENGVMGSKPHYHYLSDKFGITWETLMQKIKECDMPTSKVHILIEWSIYAE
jgi:hypothetical protein